MKAPVNIPRAPMLHDSAATRIKKMIRPAATTKSAQIAQSQACRKRPHSAIQQSWHCLNENCRLRLGAVALAVVGEVKSHIYSKPLVHGGPVAMPRPLFSTVLKLRANCSKKAAVAQTQCLCSPCPRVSFRSHTVLRSTPAKFGRLPDAWHLLSSCFKHDDSHSNNAVPLSQSQGASDSKVS